MARKIAVWLIRLAAAAAVYVIAANFWIDQAFGWDKLSRFAAAIGCGAVAVPAWGLTIAIGLRIADRRLRLALHPLLTVVLFLLLSAVVLVLAFDTSWDLLWRDMAPLAALVAIAATVDAVIGFVMERGVSAPRGQPT